VNRRFFSYGRKSVEELTRKYVMQQLIHCNLWNPPKEFTQDDEKQESGEPSETATANEKFTPPKTCESSECTSAFRSTSEVQSATAAAEDANELIAIKRQKANLPVPQFRVCSTPLVPDYNEQITAAFLRRYQQGLIVTYPPETMLSSCSTNRVADHAFGRDTHSASSDLTRSQKKSKKRKIKELSLTTSTSQSRIWKFFHPTRWSLEEVQLFHELHALWGTDWATISRLMCKSKSPSLLKMTYAKARGQITPTNIDIKPLELSICQICKKPRSGKKMVFCECCDRGYHLKCLDPPLDRIPTEAWFCSEQCSSVLHTVRSFSFSFFTLQVSELLLVDMILSISFPLSILI
jgi:hypothetical protein